MEMLCIPLSQKRKFIKNQSQETPKLWGMDIRYNNAKNIKKVFKRSKFFIYKFKKQG
jgi:hypothetical protein